MRMQIIIMLSASVFAAHINRNICIGALGLIDSLTYEDSLIHALHLIDLIFTRSPNHYYGNMRETYM